LTATAKHGPVLLVDDAENNRELYAQLFRHHGIGLFTAADGGAAIEIAERARPGVIVLNLDRPKIDGWEVARRLKVNQATRDTPIIAMTAHVGGDAKTSALAAGVDSFLTAPCFPEELLAEVRKFLG
jgi:CheY-like chemotaxis protein